MQPALVVHVGLMAVGHRAQRHGVHVRFQHQVRAGRVGGDGADHVLATGKDLLAGDPRADRAGKFLHEVGHCGFAGAAFDFRRDAGRGDQPAQ